MSSCVFFQMNRTILTKFTSTIKEGNVIVLNEGQVWIYFSNGKWILYDCRKDKLLSEGSLGGKLTSPVIKFPKALDSQNIIFVDGMKFALKCLNLYTEEIDQAWKGDIPSAELLDVDKREDKAYEISLEVLRESKIVGVIERLKDNSKYFLNIFAKDQKRVAQVACYTLQKNMEFSKANEKDTFLLWSSYQEQNFEFYRFNVNQKEDGFQKLSVQVTIRASIINSFQWDQNTVAFFGNPDDSAEAQIYLYDYPNQNLRSVSACDRDTKPGLISSMLFADLKNNRLLLSGIFGTRTLCVYNTKSKKTDFMAELTATQNLVAVGLDKKHIVEYEGERGRQKISENPGEIRIRVTKLVSKRLMILYLMKTAKLQNGKSYLEYYGDVYIAKHVADMLP